MWRIFDEILRFFYMLVFIWSYAYLHFIWYGTHQFLVKTDFRYKLPDEDLEKHATVYRSKRVSKKIILFLSGAYNLENHAYISKMMHDLEAFHGDTMKEYELICFEKSDQSSIIIYDDVAHFIKTLNDEVGGLEEVILVGFSSGGCVASSVMARLQTYKFKKKIITYDTPWQVQHNVEYFQDNLFYRPDILFFWKVHQTYSSHYNYEHIKHHLDVKNNFSGAHDLVKIIESVHGWSREKMLEETGFNFNQTADTRVYNIVSKWDPFVIRSDVHDKFVKENEDRIIWYNKVIEKETIGHCSDMAFSTSYLNEILFSIRDDYAP